MPCETHGKNCNGECIDPNIDNGMMTKIWGPPGWLFLHCVTFGYPFMINLNKPEHVIRMNKTRDFFRNIGYVLPCKYCRNSYNDFMKEIPVERFLNSRKDLTYWLYLMHNKVNNKLGVPDCNIPSFEELQQRYEAYRAKCSKTTKEEREENKSKGCVNPADGTTKRCFLQVVNCKKGDITRRENSVYYTKNNMDYILIKKEHLILLGLCVILVILGIIYKDEITKYVKGMLGKKGILRKYYNIKR
jgi:hypothetical protein